MTGWITGRIVSTGFIVDYVGVTDVYTGNIFGVYTGWVLVIEGRGATGYTTVRLFTTGVTVGGVTVGGAMIGSLTVGGAIIGGLTIVGAIIGGASTSVVLNTGITFPSSTSFVTNSLSTLPILLIVRA
jgi:hypothetical protein